MSDLQAVKEIIESWDILKKQRGEFTQRDLRNFVETQNAHCRRLISLFRTEKPDFWQSFAELGIQCATLTTPGARVIADGIDRTNL